MDSIWSWSKRRERSEILAADQAAEPLHGRMIRKKHTVKKRMIHLIYTHCNHLGENTSANLGVPTAESYISDTNTSKSCVYVYAAAAELGDKPLHSEFGEGITPFGSDFDLLGGGWDGLGASCDQVSGKLCQRAHLVVGGMEG